MDANERELIKQNTAHMLLSAEAVRFQIDPPYTYSAGGRGPIYCDNRVMLGEVGHREIITQYLLQTIKDSEIFPYFPDVVAGVATSGIPWAAILADRLRLPHAYARPEPKAHGHAKAVEGKIGPGQRVLVIEDLINTGNSSVRAIDRIRDAGGIVDYCVALVDYELLAATTLFSQVNIRPVALTDFSTLVSVAREQKYLSAEQEATVRAWQHNPTFWADQFQRGQPSP